MLSQENILREFEIAKKRHPALSLEAFEFALQVAFNVYEYQIIDQRQIIENHRYLARLAQSRMQHAQKEATKMAIELERVRMPKGPIRSIFDDEIKIVA